MKTEGAVLRQVPGRWELAELDIEEPRQGELLIEMKTAGLCHSDDHYAKGDAPVASLPFAGGHEGAGVVIGIGPNTPGWTIGDHVALSFLPVCGRCRWCSTGHQNLCDMGRFLRDGTRSDGSYRVWLDGEPAAQMCGLATFSRHTLVDVAAAIRIDPELNLEAVCLCGCGVGTGWGSAVYSADVQPGQTVIVMGVGGIGANAVQGARHGGATNIVAVDPVVMKREVATQVGATHVFASMHEATAFAQSVTDGQGADSAIICTGVLTGDDVRAAFASIRKAGTVVVTALGNADTDVAVNARELTLYQKRIQGSVFGGSNPLSDIPLMLDLYRSGQLKLDELITARYRLEDINQGYDDLHAGRNVRGIIVFG
ncbi:MAG: NDMA-dependent alcohol dehydrogenase [Acidimicrobiia bacterium]|nr:NDMA-dependent alcohol dehydrogenase [Acidimicrobiia bacterium]